VLNSRAVNWIADRRPELNQEVLICTQSGWITLQALKEYPGQPERLIWYPSGLPVETAVAWMPVPEPYVGR
jgi:hypothetical protein